MIYFVDNETGDNSHPGTSEEKAWRDLNLVNAKIFNRGDIVLFKRGCAWVGTLNARPGVKYGTFGNGSRPIIEASGASVAIRASGCQGGGVYDLAVSGAKWYGIKVDDGTRNYSVSGCLAYDNHVGIMVYDEQGQVQEHIEIHQCEVFDNQEHGICVLEENHYVTIANNIVSDNNIGDGDALRAGVKVKMEPRNAGREINVINNVCSGNRNGMYLDTLGAGLLVSSNHCYSNTKTGIVVEDTDDALIERNVCHDNEWGISLWRGCARNTITRNTCNRNLVGIVVAGGNFEQGNGYGGGVYGNRIVENVARRNTVIDLSIVHDGPEGGNVYERNEFEAESP